MSKHNGIWKLKSEYVRGDEQGTENLMYEGWSY